MGAAAPSQPRVVANVTLKKPLMPFVLSVIAFLGLIAVALSMSFVDDAPGDVGSPLAGLFHAVGAVQLVVGLGVLVSAIFIMLSGFDVKLWGAAIVGLGLVSIAALLAIVLAGTFAVIFLAIPGVLAVVAGVLARRSKASL